MALPPAPSPRPRAALPARLRRACARLRGDDRGVTAVEFALLLAPFMAVFMAIIETSIFIFSQQSLQTAVENAHRVVMTGQAHDTAGAFKTALCRNVIAVIDCQGAVQVDVRVGPPQPASAYVDGAGNFNPTAFGYQPGARDNVVTVTAMVAYPLFLPTLLPQMVNAPGGKRIMQASYAFKNEPF